MDAILDTFDWDAVERRFVPRTLAGTGPLPLDADRGGLLRSALPGRPAFEGGGPFSGLAGRLAALLAWARVDVPVAVLAAGHAHAEELIDGPASRFRHPDALWTVWLTEPSPLRASAAGPVYRLDGVVSRPLGGGVITHAVVSADSPDGPLLFAVDVRHPRVHVMADVAVAAGRPVEYSGAFRFEGVPATPLSRAVPAPPVGRRYLRLAAGAVVVGAAAGLADEVVRSPEVDGCIAATRRALDDAAHRVLATARETDARTSGASSLWIDAEITGLAADVRTVAADVLALAARLDGHPGGPGVARAEQLELALRLGARAG